MKKRFLFFLVMFFQTLGWATALESHFVDSPEYIRIKGSDTMAALARQWAKTYQAKTPGVTLEMTASGSGRGIAALINGHVEIANSSRPLKSQEVRQMMRRSGKQPVVFVVGLDAVSVMVHPLNPLNGVSLKQLAEIYGRNGTIHHWRDLGVSVPGCETRDIVRISRKNNSGTYSFFRQDVFLKRRHFHINMTFVSNSETMVQRVAQAPCAIGYSGMGFVTATVKTLCIIKDEGSCVPPTAASALDKRYPLARPLYMVTLGTPKKAVKAYLEWVVGPVGQEILRKHGFIPIPKPTAIGSPKPTATGS